MDTREATAALVAGTTSFAQWCEGQAQALDKIHEATALRPMSPQECRQSLDAHREMLRRAGQLQVQWLTLLPGVLLTAPPMPPPMPPLVDPPAVPVGRIRRWLRRVVG